MTKNIETMIAKVDEFDDEIYKLEQTIADKVGALKEKRNEMNDLLNTEIAKLAAEELADKDYGCGTSNIETGRHKIKVTVSKGVKWDEKQLHVIRQQIIDGGQNPADYIKEKLSVTETAYKGFPEDIQKVFEPARSVQPSKPKIEITRK